jgi:hypothetical protein
MSSFRARTGLITALIDLADAFHHRLSPLLRIPSGSFSMSLKSSAASLNGDRPLSHHLSAGLVQKTRELSRCTSVQSIAARQTGIVTTKDRP